MTKIILEVTEEEFERLDLIGIFNPDMAGVLWQKVIIIGSVDKAESEDKYEGYGKNRVGN